MKVNRNSLDIRKSVKKDYDLIALQYARDFGKYIEDLDVYEEFEKHLNENAKILDLGAGTGRTYSYFNEKQYEYIGLDFSEKMKQYAYNIHGEFPYIMADMMDLKKYFSTASIDGIFAVYSLFHLPKDDFETLLADIYDILKVNGIFLFTYQIGEGEEMVDEPYLDDRGKKCLYMRYYKNENIKELISIYSFEELFRKEKIETLDSAINCKKAITVFLLLKKTK